jgi:hypothetical protein
VRRRRFCCDGVSTTALRCLALGARMPWYLIRLPRGRGANAASLARNSIGSNTKWVVPSRYGVLMISDRNTRKMAFLGSNSKAAICIGGGEGADDEAGPGYLFKGECTTEEDPGYAWLRKITLRYRSLAQAEKDIEQWRTQLDIMVIRLKVAKVIKVY